MSSLDKNMLFYFRDEIEKQALMPKPLITAVEMVGKAGKTVGGAAKTFGSFLQGLGSLSRRVGAIGVKEPIGLKHVAGGSVLLGGGIVAGGSAIRKSKEMKQINKSLGPVQTSGLQTFSGGY